MQNTKARPASAKPPTTNSVLKTWNVLEEITDVLQHREPLYRDCQTLTIDTTRRTIEDVAEEIVTAVMPDPGQED